jgi:hypothetical protein
MASSTNVHVNGTTLLLVAEVDYTEASTAANDYSNDD